MPTLLDYQQVLRQAYDEATNRIRVITDATVTMSGAMEVNVVHTDDSIRLGDGTGFISSTTSGAKRAVDVNVLSDLVPKLYDAISLGYTGSNLTSVQYFQGGLAGTLVATLTLAYTGSRLDSVVRT